MYIRLVKALTILCLAVVFAAAANPAVATVLSFSADSVYRGGVKRVGVAPWLTATIDDHGGTGSVTLTLAATNLTNGKFVSGWYLNLDPAFDPKELDLSKPAKAGSFGKPSIRLGENDFKADGGGKYDIKFDFDTSNHGRKRFGKGDAVTYTINGISSLTANSFDYLSASSRRRGAFYMVAHVQGIGRCDDDGGWISFLPQVIPQIPEPATMGLLAIGSLALLLRRRR